MESANPIAKQDADVVNGAGFSNGQRCKQWHIFCLLPLLRASSENKENALSQRHYDMRDTTLRLPAARNQLALIPVRFQFLLRQPIQHQTRQPAIPPID